MQTLLSCLCAASCSTLEANIQVAFVEHLDLTVVLHRYYILAGRRSDSLDTHSFFTVKSSPSAFRIDLSLINSGGKGRTTFWRLKNKTFKTLAFHLSTFKARLGARAFPISHFYHLLSVVCLFVFSFCQVCSPPNMPWISISIFFFLPFCLAPRLGICLFSISTFAAERAPVWFQNCHRKCGRYRSSALTLAYVLSMLCVEDA